MLLQKDRSVRPHYPLLHNFMNSMISKIYDFLWNELLARKSLQMDEIGILQHLLEPKERNHSNLGV